MTYDEYTRMYVRYDAIRYDTMRRAGEGLSDSFAAHSHTRLRDTRYSICNNLPCLSACRVPTTPRARVRTIDYASADDEVRINSTRERVWRLSRDFRWQI